jgi:hypothetical protein
MSVIWHTKNSRKRVIWTKHPSESTEKREKTTFFQKKSAENVFLQKFIINLQLD